MKGVYPSKLFNGYTPFKIEKSADLTVWWVGLKSKSLVFDCF